MSKNLTAIALIAGAAIGVYFGHHYKPEEAEALFLGAMAGAFAMKIILEIADL